MSNEQNEMERGSRFHIAQQIQHEMNLLGMSTYLHIFPTNQISKCYFWSLYFSSSNSSDLWHFFGKFLDEIKINVIGILHAARALDSECFVFTSRYDNLYEFVIWIHNFIILFDWFTTFFQWICFIVRFITNDSVILFLWWRDSYKMIGLHLGLMSYLSNVKWIARDMIWIFTDESNPFVIWINTLFFCSLWQHLVVLTFNGAFLLMSEFRNRQLAEWLFLWNCWWWFQNCSTSRKFCREFNRQNLLLISDKFLLFVWFFCSEWTNFCSHCVASHGLWLWFSSISCVSRGPIHTLSLIITLSIILLQHHTKSHTQTHTQSTEHIWRESILSTVKHLNKTIVLSNSLFSNFWFRVLVDFFRIWISLIQSQRPPTFKIHHRWPQQVTLRGVKKNQSTVVFPRCCPSCGTLR